MRLSLTRTLRTPSSERFLIEVNEVEVAALELHYLINAKISGTLILFDDNGFADDGVPDLLRLLDERLLPEASIEEGNLSFTVVRGRIVGSFVAEQSGT